MQPSPGIRRGRSLPQAMFGKGGEEEAIRRPAISDHGEGDKSYCSNVHVRTDGLICPLPSCKRAFQPRSRKKGGKGQQFCCPDHRRMFFSLARKVGTILLQDNGHDPNLKAIIDRILGTLGERTTSDEKKGTGSLQYLEEKGEGK
jgi:hypothetical protein